MGAAKLTFFAGLEVKPERQGVVDIPLIDTAIQSSAALCLPGMLPLFALGELKWLHRKIIGKTLDELKQLAFVHFLSPMGSGQSP
ncbi:hypothetical protein CYJ10_29365 [Cupriavidus pauculus]|uniref:Uncharacterized protein n=1 Tax=Cupriavidus pauculus TaxID=82633 RepID=A0A2N5C410_9BURK|nr:hypothetical protein CYJ10_29365 [Cupriavidus pauculus]